MNNNELKEEVLYYPIKKYLEDKGFEVKSEINHCDVIAIKEELIIGIEMKKRLNLEVIIQGVLRQKVVDLVYVAVPKNYRVMKTKKWRNTCYLLRRLNLGLLLVSIKKEGSYVEDCLRPEPYSRVVSKKLSSKKRKALLQEFNNRIGDYNIGGSTKKKLVTAYREMAIHIAVILRRNGPTSIKDIKVLGAEYSKTSRILQDNYYKWFERVKRGVYTITEKGKHALEEYPELVDYYKKK